MSTATGTQGFLYPVNRSEFGYVALDGLVGTINQPYLFRFSAPVSVEQMRHALREVVRCHPRLRAIVEPGVRRYYFNARPDDVIIDQIFAQAFHVEAGLDADDAQAMQAYHNRFLNEPSFLEHGLALKARFIPHPQRPVLFLNVPHLFGDGRSMMLWIGDMMRALNGLPIEPQPMESHPMWPAIVPQRWRDWPAKLRAARRHRIAEKQQFKAVNVVQLPTRPSENYSTHAVCHHIGAVSADVLRAAAKRLGVSTNTLILSALAEAYLAMRPDDPKAAAVIRVSVDLRPYFPPEQAPLAGNQVGACLIFEQGRIGALERAQSVHAKVKAGLARYKNREMCWHYLLEELLPSLGRTLAGYLVVQTKRKDRFVKISCQCSTLGNGSFLNPKDAVIRIAEFYPIVTSVSPLMGVVELEGKLFTTFTWQTCETTWDEVQALLAGFDVGLQKMVST